LNDQPIIAGLTSTREGNKDPFIMKMVKPKPVKPLTVEESTPNIVEDALNLNNEEKRGKKRKAESAPIEKEQTKPRASKEVKVNSEVTDEVVKLNNDSIESCVAAFTKLLELDGEKKKELFASEGENLNLIVSGIRILKDTDQQIIKCKLPHSPLSEHPEVCLFVKDNEKGIKADHEDNVREFNELLQNNGVKCVTQVISLRELKVEYKQYEAKNQLVGRFDKFLADDRIIRLLPPILGKAFYKRKKLPVQVNLRSKSLSAELTRAVNTVTLPLTNHGSCSSVKVGKTTLSKSQMADNIKALVEVIEKKYPGGWKNIRSIHLQGASLSLPLYASFRDNQSVGVVAGVKRAGKEMVSGELSTVVGATVKVMPGGSVKVTVQKDPEWDEEPEEENGKKEKERGKKERITHEEDGAENEDKEKGVKSDKDTKKKDADNDESEDELEDQELEYMAKVAAEEEEIEANEVKRLAQLQGGKVVKSDDESEDEETAPLDDDAEAENLLSEGDESESEDELYMKSNTSVGDSDDGEDDSSTKKRKKNSKGDKKSKAKKIKLQPKSNSDNKKKMKQKKFIEKKKKDGAKPK